MGEKLGLIITVLILASIIVTTILEISGAIHLLNL